MSKALVITASLVSLALPKVTMAMRADNKHVRQPRHNDTVDENTDRLQTILWNVAEKWHDPSRRRAGTGICLCF